MKPRFAAISLVVSDMARSLAFYRQIGLDVPADADAAPHAEVALAGGLRLLFDTVESVRSFAPDWQPGTGQMGLAFECDSPSDVDAMYAALTDAGYEGHLAPWDAFWGQRYAVVHDPDGNGVDLFAPLPG
jgi:uncharacterized glyoxalase superfamily protein PhnB